jgi:hypothetical protein
MKSKTVNLYTFDELSDSAKEKARDWYRNGALDYDWWDYLYEDAARIGLKITEFDLGNRKHIKGRLTATVGTVCQRIMAEHGTGCDTYKLAEAWAAKSDGLTALLEAKCDDEAEEERDKLEAEQEANEAEFEQALLEEYFSLLDKEYEYLNSNEQVDESIRINEYTFTESGKREDEHEIF